MSTTAVAQLLSNTLYFRRFFPYYAFNVVAGVDSEGEPPPRGPHAPRKHARSRTAPSATTPGKGAVFTYDAVGSYERISYAAQGAGQKLIIPALDNLVRARWAAGGAAGGGRRHSRRAAPPQIGHKHRQDQQRELSAEEVVEIVKDLFVTAGERDIYTGDAVDLYVIRADGVENISFDLKKD